MNPTFDAVLRSWPFDPWLLLSLLLTAGIYLRGWLVLHRRNPCCWHGGLLAAFLGGLTAIGLALASPIEPFVALLLQVHMVQHLLLMMVAPPLLWLGAPLFPLLRGLPRNIRTTWVAPLLRAPALRRVCNRLTHPALAWALFVAVTWLWHVPPVYELALRSRGWHDVQHLFFLSTGLLFWYAVVRPYPSRPTWSPWLLIPFLLLADVQNTVLSALFTFSDRVLYPYYAEVPHLGGLTPLQDQSTAGLIMWIPGSLAFLLPLFGVGVRLLYGPEKKTRRQGDKETRRQGDKETRRQGGRRLGPEDASARIPLPLVGGGGSSVSLSPGLLVSLSPCLRVSVSGFDLLRVPLLGRFLRWRHARLALQLPLLLLAGLVIVDGLAGPQVSPMNLAGVLPWIHWRGLVVVGLLAAGNVFCLGCPFLLPRTLARRWLPQGWAWPRWLRNKWPAVLLLVVFLWAYEAFALWDSPWWTAWIAVGYFMAALVIDGLFRGAAFCKYVCPIGQFNFVQSLVSPLEVKVREPNVCAACRTKDCIRGRDGIPGCELGLFQPRKAGNTDCTFCLDCVHACPHDNIGILATLPAQELARDSFRSGLGRFARRPDLAALIIVLVFGAFANAAGMVAPVLEWQAQLTALLHQPSPLLVTTLSYIFGLVILPVLLVGSSALVGRWWGRLRMSWLETATRFTYALVPLGLGMWLAHYSFHFLASFDAAVPAVQRFAGDLGWRALGEPEWSCACCRPVAAWLPRLEILFLDLGLLLSLYTGYRIALARAERPGHALRALAPWALLMVLLFAAGVWIVLQPMQMRGTLSLSG
jgi:cytochrome c oxidase assembly factor CtaG/polyferredoxin